MKPPPFAYHAPTSLPEAVELLGEYGEDGRALAGGQSLVPMLSLRLARPAHLIDLNGVGELSRVEAREGGLSVSSMVRHRTVERSDVVRQRSPLLSEAVSLIGHAVIRNRGTLGGSLAHADPAAELPAVAAALDAELVVRSVRGDRTIRAQDFFLGHYTTALEPDECLIEVLLPPWPARAGWSFQEVARRHSDMAMVGVAAVVRLEGSNVISDARIGLAGVAGAPVRAHEAESILMGSVAEREVFEAAGASAAAGIDPPADLHASAAYRRHAVRVLVRRALEAAAQRARDSDD